MGQILSSALLEARNSAAMRSGQAAFEQAPSIPSDDDIGQGECAVTLHDLPVTVAYELTFDGTEEIAEVTEVFISGHAIPASDFAADIRAEWGRDCMRMLRRAGLA